MLKTRRAAELESYGSFRLSRRAADEDVTRLGEELTDLHFETLTDELDADMRADYQQALDSYEKAKSLSAPPTREDVTQSTQHPRGRPVRDGVRPRPCDEAALPLAGRHASSTRPTGRRTPTSPGRRPAG